MRSIKFRSWDLEKKSWETCDAPVSPEGYVTGGSIAFYNRFNTYCAYCGKKIREVEVKQ